ncbi:MAG: protein translocase subunit SecF, partial [Thermodesulfobacteriota bacterium]
PLGRANLGIDFAGGVAIQLKFDKPFKINEMRKLLEEGGFKDADLQEFTEGNKLFIRLKTTEGNLRNISDGIKAVFLEKLPDNTFAIDSITEVGPTVGKKLQKDAVLAIAIALLGILLYVAWRFEFKFGVAAVIATSHDVLAVLGLYYITNKEINLLIITALLTLAGYSLTDTVVVFDRIRENLRKRAKEGLETLINRSINEVLRRTIVTSVTTLMVLLALIYFGGEVIHDFSLALFLGVLIGTYSSVFVASPLLLIWKGKRGKLIR